MARTCVIQCNLKNFPFGADSLPAEACRLFRSSGIRKRISAAEAANLIHTTKDSIRNWERNGLINVGVQPYERRTYGANDVERMKIIKTMLSIGFSMSTIKRFFVLYDEGKVQEAIKSIQTTPNAEDILTTADAWIHMLTLKEEHTKQILSMIPNI